MLKEDVAPPLYSSVSGVQRNRRWKRHIFKTRTSQGHARSVGRGTEGLSVVWLLTTLSALGPRLHPLPPAGLTWIDRRKDKAG